MITHIKFIMGPTCSGKSTFLKQACKEAPDIFGTVEVGKLLRAKYPPEYFKGQNNPKHTAAEAWALCEEGVQKCRQNGKRIVLVDGQPRDVPQVNLCFTKFPSTEYSSEFWLIDACLEERERRARASRSGPDLETLALPRLTNDMIAYYTVLVELLKAKVPVRIFDSSNAYGVDPEILFSTLVSRMINENPA